MMFQVEAKLDGRRTWHEVRGMVFNDRELADTVCANNNDRNRGWSKFRVVKFDETEDE